MFLQRVRFKYFQNKILFLKFFISIFFVSTITALVITVSMFYWFRGRTISDINKINKAALLNLSNVFSNYVDFGKRYATGIYSNPTIKAVILSGQKDWNNNVFNAQGQIQSIITTNNYINSVVIFDKTDILLNVTRKAVSEKSLEELFSMIKTKNMMQEPAVWVMNGRAINKDKNVNTMTIAFQDGIMKKDIDGAVAVNLDLNELQKEIISQSSDKNQKFFIVNGQGKIIIATDENLINENMSDSSFIEKIISSGKEYGDFTETTNKVTYAISFIKTNQEGYYAISQIEYNQSISELIKARNILLMLGIILLIVIIVISGVMANKMYRPIGKLFFNIKNMFGEVYIENDNFDEIEIMSQVIRNAVDKLNSLEKENKDSLVVKMLTYENNNPETIANLKTLIFKGSERNEYCIAVIKINNFNELIDNNTAEALSLQISSIITMTGPIFNNIINYNICTISNDHIIIVISETENSKLRDLLLLELFEEYKKTIKATLSIDITVGISDISCDISKLKNYYLEAFQLTRYSIVYENGLVVDSKAAGRLNRKGMPESTVEQMINALIEGSSNNFNLYLDNLFNESKNYCYNSIVKLFSQLISSIVKLQYGIINESATTQHMDSIEIYKVLSEIADYNQLRAFIDDLYNNTSKTIDEMNSKKVQDILSNVISYINTNYNDSQLSIGYISKKNSLSNSYFSKIFNEYFGCSFPEYVNNIRLEKAKEMLINNTDMDISEIAAKVGYGSTTYFTTSFKKRYGITPSKFRLNNIIEH